MDGRWKETFWTGGFGFQGTISHDGYVCAGYRAGRRRASCTDVCAGDGCGEMFQKLAIQLICIVTIWKIRNRICSGHIAEK